MTSRKEITGETTDEAAKRMSELRLFLSGVVPFWKTMGFELKELAPGSAVFEGVVADGLTQNGILHGGVMASIADSACAAAAISQLFPNFYATTVHLQVNYLRSIKQGGFRAKGRCIKAGRSILFCEAKVENEAGDLLCTATSQLLPVALTTRQ